MGNWSCRRRSSSLSRFTVMAPDHTPDKPGACQRHAAPTALRAARLAEHDSRLLDAYLKILLAWPRNLRRNGNALGGGGFICAVEPVISTVGHPVLVLL